MQAGQKRKACRLSDTCDPIAETREQVDMRLYLFSRLIQIQDGAGCVGTRGKLW